MYNYFYDDKLFKTRFDVYDYVLYEKNGILDSKLNLHFNFSGNKFVKYDWNVDPSISLDALYRRRALEIREKYDYIILHYTGGMDSHEVLNVFLKNNIHIDEIQTSHHEKAVDLIGIKASIDYSIGHLTEYNLFAKGVLKDISVRYPKIKITDIDVSGMLANDDFSFTEFNRQGAHPFVFKLQKSNSYSLISHNEKNHRSGRVCVIRGSEKPGLYVKNNTLLFSFHEAVTYGGPQRYEDFGYQMENFFWSYDDPLIPIKQSHIVLNALRSNTKLKEKFLSGSVSEEFTRSHICPLLYKHHHEINFISNKNINNDKTNPDKTAYFLLKKSNNLNRAFHNRQNYYLNRYKFLNGSDMVATKRSYVIGLL
jgi:hypothetical protein